jgi:ankyrin repeat protein
VLSCVFLQPIFAQQANERQIHAFNLAVKANDFSFVARMDRLGLSPSTRDSLGNNLLMIGIREGGSALVLLMLEDTQWQASAVINHENTLGENALMLSALNGQEQVVLRLIGLKAQVNREGWTALHYAATSGHVGIISILLDHHAYIDAESPNRTTPLMMAARFNRAAATRFLLEAGADPTIANEAGLKARDYAAQGNEKDLEFVLSLKEISFENRRNNQIHISDRALTLEEVVIQSGGSVVREAESTASSREVGPSGQTEVFEGIR